MDAKREANIFTFGFVAGIVFSIVLGWLLVAKVADSQTPMTWCDDIARANKNETYKIVYDRCYAEYEERKKNER